MFNDILQRIYDVLGGGEEESTGLDMYVEDTPVDTPINPGSGFGAPINTPQVTTPQKNLADNGTLFQIDAGRLTQQELVDFINNQSNFTRMVDDWTVEDDPRKRKKIVEDYNARYNFINNPVYNDILDQFSQYDYGDEHDTEAHQSENNPFTVLNRSSWNNWAKDYIRQVVNSPGLNRRA